MDEPQVFGVVTATVSPPSDAGSDTPNTITRQASRLAGFREPGQAIPTREELLEQGVPGPQADALLVRMHEEEILTQNFRRWILCFSGLVCLLTPAMLGILVWMIVEFWRNREKECDVPLNQWAQVVFVVVVYNSTLNRPSPTGSLVVRCFCCWQRDPQDPQPIPLRVRLYNFAITLFIFVWNCIGLHWVRISGQDRSERSPSCKDVVPGLVLSVKVYATFNLAFTIFMYISMIGFAHVLRAAMHRGYLHSNNAAPKGALERNTDAVKPGDPALEEHPTCSICLEEFDDRRGAREILKTRMCSHLFHRQCIQGWLNVNRTCPLCRLDLGEV